MIESAGPDAPLSLLPSPSSCSLSMSLSRDFVFTGAGFAVVVFLRRVYVIHGK
jgi:hypothetical protein